MNITTVIFMLIGAGAAAYGIYTLIKIRNCMETQGTLVGYVEEENVGPDDTGVSQYPVYEYYFEGQTRQYQSKISVIPFLKHETRTLYVDGNGKVFEKENGILMLIIAVIVIAVQIFFLYV